MSVPHSYLILTCNFRAYLVLASFFFAVLGYGKLWDALGFDYVSRMSHCSGLLHLPVLVERLELLDAFSHVHAYLHSRLRARFCGWHYVSVASMDYLHRRDFSREP